ncbi:MAG: hypothetical protein SV686_04955 [Thermodesulfobacteriota bacterium]|nr:hypothetical protein [Thermodesulfobacteriota bacterium]
MLFDISHEVVKEATKCEHNYACINNEQHRDNKMCNVWYANGKNVLFLNTEEPDSCPYRHPFGYRQICTCPVYFELYNKYMRT